MITLDSILESIYKQFKDCVQNRGQIETFKTLFNKLQIESGKARNTILIESISSLLDTLFKRMKEKIIQAIEKAQQELQDPEHEEAIKEVQQAENLCALNQEAILNKIKVEKIRTYIRIILFDLTNNLCNIAKGIAELPDIKDDSASITQVYIYITGVIRGNKLETIEKILGVPSNILEHKAPREVLSSFFTALDEFVSFLKEVACLNTKTELTINQSQIDLDTLASILRELAPNYTPTKEKLAGLLTKIDRQLKNLNTAIVKNNLQSIRKGLRTYKKLVRDLVDKILQEDISALFSYAEDLQSNPFDIEALGAIARHSNNTGLFIANDTNSRMIEDNLKNFINNVKINIFNTIVAISSLLHKSLATTKGPCSPDSQIKENAVFPIGDVRPLVQQVVDLIIIKKLIESDEEQLHGDIPLALGLKLAIDIYQTDIKIPNACVEWLISIYPVIDNLISSNFIKALANNCPFSNSKEISKYFDFIESICKDIKNAIAELTPTDISIIVRSEWSDTMRIRKSLADKMERIKTEYENLEITLMTIKNIMSTDCKLNVALPEPTGDNLINYVNIMSYTHALVTGQDSQKGINEAQDRFVQYIDTIKFAKTTANAFTKILHKLQGREVQNENRELQ